MPLNTDFWSAAQEDYPSSYGMKRFTKTYKELILDGSLPLNEEWDKTISPWAMSPRMGENAHYQNDLINRCWLYPDINTMKGIADSQSFEEDYIVKTSIAAQPQHEFPFIVMCGDGGQGVALPSPDWKGRISPDQEAVDANFTNVKTRFYMLTDFDYSRLVWLIRVFVASVGYNNSSYDVSHISWGSWYDLADITDEMYTDILSGNKSITGIKFIPYYAANENYPNSRSIVSSFGFLSLADTQPLDGSASGLGVNSPYTEDYIDYSLTAFANYGTSDHDNNSFTFSLGSTGSDTYHQQFRCKINGTTWFDSTIEWAEGRPSWGVDGNFTEGHYNNGLGTDSTFWKIEGLNGSGNWMYMYYRQRLDESLLNTKDKIRDYILTQAAYLGCWFTEKSSVASSGEMSKNNSDAYIGVIEDDGLTHGQYQKGSEIDTPNADWVNPWEESPYIPYVPDPDPDPTDWDEDLHSVMHTVALDQNIGCMDYLMSGQALGELIRVLTWYKVKEANGEINEGTCVTLFGTTDPLECIQTVICYPYDLSSIWTGNGDGSALPVVGTYMSASQGVYCGLTELVVTGYDTGSGPWNYLYTPFDSILQINWHYSFGIYNPKTIPYFDRYKNFLSYEPYCDAELYIPFCGSVKIDPQLFVGHNIKVSYNVAISEGSCRADIYRDNLFVDSITGNIGAQVGLDSADLVAKVNAVQQANATISSQKTSLVKSIAGFGIAAAATVATGGTGAPLAASLSAGALGATASAVSARQSIETAEYQIKQAEVPFHKLTTGHGFSVLSSEDGVRLNVYRPTCLPGYSRTDWGRYGHTTGFACLKNDVLSNYHGLTVCSSVDLTGTTCTSKEAEMIKGALKTGVYLP